VPEAIQFFCRVIDLSLSVEATWFISSHFKEQVLAIKAKKLRVDKSFSVFAHLSKKSSEGKGDARYS
jgi:hypothetical protein